MTHNVRMNPTTMVVGNLETTSGSEEPHIRDMRFHFEGDAPAPGQAVVIHAAWDNERWLWAVTHWLSLESQGSLAAELEAAAIVEAAATQPAAEQASAAESDRREPQTDSATAPDAASAPEATAPVKQDSAQRKGFAFGQKTPSPQAKAPTSQPTAGLKATPAAEQTSQAAAVAPTVVESSGSAESRPGFAFGQKPRQAAPSSAPRRMYTPPRPATRPGSTQQSGVGAASTLKTTTSAASPTTPATPSRPLNATLTQARATVPVRPPQQVGGASRRGGFGMGPAEANAATDMPAPFPAASVGSRGTLNSSDSDDRLREWGMNPADSFLDDIPF